MRRLVTIDLRTADIAAFDAYEARVLALLPKYDAKVEARVRTVDGAMETHLLHFPNSEAFELYLADPVRLALQDDWVKCGARSVAVEVEALAEQGGSGETFHERPPQPRCG